MSRESRRALAESIRAAAEGRRGELPEPAAQACREQTLSPARLISGPLGAPLGAWSGRARVEAADTLAAALREAGAGARRVGALVFCSATRPGGGWLSGGLAQEESISLRSTWALGCRHPLFHDAERPAPFYDDATLAMPGFVLAAEPGQWLAEPAPVEFVGFCAPNLRAAREMGEPIGEGDFRRRVQEALARRCSLALRALAEARCDAAVLGAVGCGVFEVPPELAAAAWREALARDGAPLSSVAFALGERPAPDLSAAFASLGSPAPASAPGRRGRG